MASNSNELERGHLMPNVVPSMKKPPLRTAVWFAGFVIYAALALLALGLVIADQFGPTTEARPELPAIPCDASIRCGAP